jgi:vitamin B12 transport system permease protein
MLTARSVADAAFALFSAAMLGLAAGAVWMLPTMQLQRPLAWLALPIGWLLGLAVRAWIRPSGTLAALAAAMATALAAAYVTVLTAAARVAGLMGLGLLQAMRESGSGMLLQLARLSLSPLQLACFAAGTVLAAWCAWRSPRRRPASPADAG